jgi:hypothetical protein
MNELKVINKNKILTIAIPTYNRLDELYKLICQIFENKINDFAEILIIDDGETKEVKNFLANKNNKIHEKVTVFENEGNLGYASSFIKIFEKCETAFVLITSDDDLLIVENFNLLFKSISKFDPDFISPQFLKLGKKIRGINENRMISVEEFRLCSNHAPGLIYKISSCAPFIKKLKCRLHRGKSDVSMYPQVILILYLINSNKKCFWFNFPIAYEGANLPSEIKDLDGKNYWEFSSRCNQLIDFEEFIMSLDVNDNSKKILKLHRRTAYGEIIGSLTKSSPGLAYEFYRSLYFLPLKAIYRYLKNYFIINKFKIK